MSTQLSYTRGSTLKAIVFDTATRVATFSADLTDSPQESGGVVTDGWVKKPDSLDLNCTLSDYPLSGNANSNTVEPGRAQRLVNEMIDAQAAGLLCSVDTPWRAYASMRINSIKVSDDKPSKGVLAFTISLRESVIANSSTVALATPTERKPQGLSDKGKKGAEDSDANKKKESYLHKAKKGIVSGVNQLFPGFFKP